MALSESPLDYSKASAIMTKWGSPLSRQVFFLFFPFFFFFLCLFWKEENWSCLAQWCSLSLHLPIPPQTSWEDTWKMTVHHSVFCTALYLCDICKGDLHLLDILEGSVNCTISGAQLLLLLPQYLLCCIDLRSKTHCSQKLFLLTPQLLDQPFIFFKAI